MISLDKHSFNYSLVLMLMILFQRICFADGMTIRDVEIWKDQQRYYLNSKINCDLSDESIEALHHGVALEILVDIRTRFERKLIWDKTVRQSTVAYRIEYHPLSQRYVLTELNRYLRKDFQYLGKVFDDLGNIKKWPLVDEDDLSSDKKYYVAIRAKLDISALPAPLRPLALISKKWHLNSNWQRWELVL